MPAYQTGIDGAVGRFATELRDRVARVRGSSAVDPISRAPPAGSTIPATSGSSSGRARPSSRARRASTAAAWTTCAATTSAWPRARRCSSGGPTTCWRRSIGSPTISGAASAALTQEVDQGATSFLDFNADNLFYTVKGKLYAYYLILRELEHDYADVIRERNLQASWDELLTSARLGATLHPWMVSNGPLDSRPCPTI